MPSLGAWILPALLILTALTLAAGKMLDTRQKEKRSDLDGLAKNTHKLYVEMVGMWHDISPMLLALVKKPWDMHLYVDLYVETRRNYPYVVGHGDTFVYTALIALSIVEFSHWLI